jgi:MAE_28990/MAE_18760-like HEPN
MTIGFRDDFAIRKAQVSRYLEVVEQQELATNAQAHVDGQAERLNVLRGGHFLILYNLVESSIRGAVEAIHDRIVTDRVPLQDLTDSIRRDVIRSFKSRCNPDEHRDMTDVPVELVAIALDIDAGYPFSGNIDARKIREIGDIYGFSTVTPRETTRDGADLLTIKSIRNDLAHGIKSYDEVGRDHLVSDLKDLSDRSTAYIEAILIAVERFLVERRFLRPPEPPPAT